MGQLPERPPPGAAAPGAHPPATKEFGPGAGEGAAGTGGTGWCAGWRAGNTGNDMPAMIHQCAFSTSQRPAPPLLLHSDFKARVRSVDIGPKP